MVHFPEIPLAHGPVPNWLCLSAFLNASGAGDRNAPQPCPRRAVRWALNSFGILISPH